MRHDGYKLLHKREGKGRAKKIKPANHISNLASNYASTENHRISRAVTEFCVKYGVSVVVLEDLRNFKFSDRELRNWPYRDEQQKIANKMMEEGIEVRFARPYNTSKTCSFCGHFNEHFTFDYRKKHKWPKFKCEKCGKQASADYNAAKNLSQFDLEETLSYEEWSKGKFLKKKDEIEVQKKEVEAETSESSQLVEA